MARPRGERLRAIRRPGPGEARAAGPLRQEETLRGSFFDGAIQSWTFASAGGWRTSLFSALTCLILSTRSSAFRLASSTTALLRPPASVFDAWEAEKPYWKVYDD